MMYFSILIINEYNPLKKVISNQLFITVLILLLKNMILSKLEKINASHIKIKAFKNKDIILFSMTYITA